MKTALIIPIYQARERCISFLQSFQKDDFDYMLVIDDGSGEKYSWIYDEIKKTSPFEVLSYSENKGKGHAMKEGLKYLLSIDPTIDILLTADGDGQHLKKDILHIRDFALEHPDSLILGTRNVMSDDIPRKSKIGNDMARAYMRWSTHLQCLDTQTGLRAIPKKLFELFLEVPGEHYDQEMNFLVDAAHICSIKEERIETVYENNNEGSHFKPLLDSYRIYQGPIKYLASLLLMWGISIGLFAILTVFVSLGNWTPYISLALASIVSEVGVVILSIFVAFPKRKGIGARNSKHYFIFFSNFAISSAFLCFFSSSGLNLVLLKFLADLASFTLFFLLSIIWSRCSIDNFPKD